MQFENGFGDTLARDEPAPSFISQSISGEGARSLH
jgi:hypothetical protein